MNLFDAIRNNDTAKVQELIKNGEDGADTNAKNKYGDTPLHFAACIGQTEIVKLLIDAGANIKVKNNNGNPPLHLAASGGHIDIANLLIEAGATTEN